MMKNKFYILLSLVAILSLGCATTTPVKMYQGEKLPKEQVAIITAISHAPSIGTWHVGSAMNWILAVDGTRLDDSFWHDLGRKSVEVLPGWHKILVRFKREVQVFSGRVHREVCFEFSAEAGHEYWILSDSNGLKIGKSLFVLDRTTGKRVASETVE